MIKYSSLIALVSVLLQAASFDCAKSSSIVEKTICSYPHLDAMDDELSQAYAQIKNSFSEEDKKILLNNQRGWLKKQKTCETSDSVEGCLKALYEERIVYFNELAQNRFVRQNDVLTDHLTQMEWQDNFIVQNGHYDKKSKPSIHTWEEAKAYCENLTLDGKSDWRLPNIEELRYAVSIKNRFKYGLDSAGYDSSTMGENYYLDTNKAINISDFNPLFEDYESTISSASPYIRCVRGEAFLEDSHTPLPKTVLAKNPFHLEMSKNDELCHSMGKVYNDDVQKDGMIHFDRHVEYNWLNWKKKVIFKKEDDYSSEKDSFGINSFDINNDGKVETVLFRRKYFNIYKDTDHMLDEVIYFEDDKTIEYESMTLNELTKNKITKRFDTHERYRLFSSKEEFLNGDYILRPFKFRNGYYLSFFGSSGKEPFDERSYSDIVITQLDANNTLNDICHFKRTLQDTSKQELDKNLKIFHSSASAKERREALKMITALGKYRDNPAVIYESCQEGLFDKDEHVRSYSIDNIAINEKSIPLLLKTIIDDTNDINKIKATFNIGRYFTNNGSDPSEYYYVIDEHMALALQAYDALVELGGRRRSDGMAHEMRAIMTSEMGKCDTKKYKNLDLVYQRFKGKLVLWDEEAYEKCQSKNK